MTLHWLNPHGVLEVVILSVASYYRNVGQLAPENFTLCYCYYYNLYIPFNGEINKKRNLQYMLYLFIIYYAAGLTDENSQGIVKVLFYIFLKSL